jgi:hypothetical protein
VFCSQCGRIFPVIRVSCQSCGHPIAPAPILTSFTNAAVAVAPALSSSPEPRTRVPRAPYIWSAFEVLCFTACAAGGARFPPSYSGFIAPSGIDFAGDTAQAAVRQACAILNHKGGTIQ